MIDFIMLSPRCVPVGKRPIHLRPLNSLLYQFGIPPERDVRNQNKVMFGKRSRRSLWDVWELAQTRWEQLRVQLHPDKTKGSHEPFATMSHMYDCIMRRFAARGIGILLAVLIPTLNARAEYGVESSTNLIEWHPDQIAWDTVLAMTQTNPATAGNAHKYYRLADSEPQSPALPPQSFYSVSWSSNAGYATWDAYVSWPVNADTNVLGYDVQARGNAVPYSFRRTLAGRFSTNVVVPSLSVTPHELTVTPIVAGSFNATARQTLVPPAPNPERVYIGDPFFPTQPRKLTWDYAGSVAVVFEIWWGDTPANLVQVGETTQLVWPITIPARLGWFGVRARTMDSLVSKWATVPNLK